MKKVIPVFKKGSRLSRLIGGFRGSRLAWNLHFCHVHLSLFFRHASVHVKKGKKGPKRGLFYRI